ncbi:hypothetical protein [Enterococcus casseliflavus]|uniref:hypothetical protein n=1 Tax=Enterococcus casseliflavus TaxID=37734 RepID=UPI001BD13051|nr:hypothetical protein [Enterococcus casseliflavus]
MSFLKKSKIACFIASLFIVVSPFFGTLQIVAANEINTSVDTEAIEQELINQYAEDLEFIYEHAAVTDREGNIVQINLTVMREKYGNNEFYDMLERDFCQQQPQLRKANFVDCMKKEFEKIVGLDIAKQIFTPQVKNLIASKAWKKASEVIIKTLGKKLGTAALKKILGKLVPGGIPAQIIFSAGKCGIKAVI